MKMKCCSLQVLFQGNNQRFEEKMSFPIGQDVLSTNIVHMNMREGINNITVQAIGKLLIESDIVPYNITLSTEKPWKDRKFIHPWFTIVVSMIQFSHTFQVKSNFSL